MKNDKKDETVKMLVANGETIDSTSTEIWFASPQEALEKLSYAQFRLNERAFGHEAFKRELYYVSLLEFYEILGVKLCDSQVEVIKNYGWMFHSGECPWISIITAQTIPDDQELPGAIYFYPEPKQIKN